MLYLKKSDVCRKNLLQRLTGSEGITQMLSIWFTEYHVIRIFLNLKPPQEEGLEVACTVTALNGINHFIAHHFPQF